MTHWYKAMGRKGGGEEEANPRLNLPFPPREKEERERKKSHYSYIFYQYSSRERGGGRKSRRSKQGIVFFSLRIRTRFFSRVGVNNKVRKKKKEIRKGGKGLLLGIRLSIQLRTKEKLRPRNGANKQHALVRLRNSFVDTRIRSKG